MTMQQHPDTEVVPAVVANERRQPNRPAATALAVATVYTAVRIWWQLSGPPGDLSAVGGDLVAVTGWGAVVLCSLAAGLSAALLRGHLEGAAGRWLRTAAALAGLTMVASGAMLLLDVVGGLLPGLGIQFYPLGTLSRTACAGAGVLLVLAARADSRAAAGACDACGRRGSVTGALNHTPRWAWAAAYTSMTACMIRIGAQLTVGMDESPLSAGASALLFELGFVLDGTLLPLALVHRWGRIWPRWVPPLAGRRVPRWLVLGPGIGISGGLVAYFGMMQLQMIAERLAGRNPFPPSGGLDLPEAFFWVSVPAYLTWGVGLAVASLAYYRRTARACSSCGR